MTIHQHATDRALKWAVVLLLVLIGVLPLGAAPSSHGDGAAEGRMWEQLVRGATALRLPTAFLAAMPPDFVQFEFADLRTYAAEYHPSEHRMVLNRTLSFHAAGRALRPLKTMTAKELEVLYHELFHAYMDFLESHEGRDSPISGAPSDDLMMMARKMQICRYREVAITPVVQRSQETEVRYLSDSEAWEALNETWAVFVGWAIWSQLEIEKKGGQSVSSSPRLAEQWVARFRHVMHVGELRGYYAPQDPEERRVTQKRFLAASDRISIGEAMLLMRQIFDLPEKFVVKAGEAVANLNNFQDRHQCALGMLGERKK